MKLLNYLFDFVILTSKTFNIDESHALKHSMDVFHFSNEIFRSELSKNPYLEDQKKIIDICAILHDMCDKKYMNEKMGIKRISDYINDITTEEEHDIALKIISTMSYSTVKKNGFPALNEYQLAYNIVREADLLASYDVDRCIMYQMLKNDIKYDKSFEDAKNIFNNRVLKYRDDKLFTTDYAILQSKLLHFDAIKRINNMNALYKIKL
jgi:HD superfamily phosphodiesterase